MGSRRNRGPQPPDGWTVGQEAVGLPECHGPGCGGSRQMPSERALEVSAVSCSRQSLGGGTLPAFWWGKGARWVEFREQADIPSAPAVQNRQQTLQYAGVFGCRLAPAALGLKGLRLHPGGSGRIRTHV